MRLLKSESAVVYVIDRGSPFVSVITQNGRRNYHHCSDHFFWDKLLHHHGWMVRNRIKELTNSFISTALV